MPSNSSKDKVLKEEYIQYKWFESLPQNTYPSPSRSPCCSICLTCSSLTFPVLFITSRNSVMETFPSPFLSNPPTKVLKINSWIYCLFIHILPLKAIKRNFLFCERSSFFSGIIRPNQNIYFYVLSGQM